MKRITLKFKRPKVRKSFAPVEKVHRDRKQYFRKKAKKVVRELINNHDNY